MSNATCSMKQAWAAAVVAYMALGWPVAAFGQVGRSPQSSPYRDLSATKVLALAVGVLGGSAGSAGVGPTDGPFVGARFDLHAGGPVDVWFGLGVASLDRLVIDPTVAADDRILETTSQSVVLLDVGLALLLTGEKTWHGFVPYVGVSLGLALGGSVDADTLSGFRFNTHFQVGPQLGVRWYPTDRLMFRVEGRDILWQLKYPGVFFPPASAPTSPSVLDPAIMNDTEWTHHPMLTLTLGYAIRL